MTMQHIPKGALTDGESVRTCKEKQNKDKYKDCEDRIEENV